MGRWRPAVLFRRVARSRWRLPEERIWPDGDVSPARRMSPVTPFRNLVLWVLLKQGPERLGYETPLWTCWRVAHLIEKEFGVAYHAGHVWKLLRGLNWSVQRPTAVRWNEMKRPSVGGRSNVGPPLKKSPPTRAHDRLHRRKWIEPAPASLPHLGAARRDPRAPVSLQLEDHLSGGGHDAVELLFPNLRKGDRQRASGGIPGKLGPTTRLPSAHRMGPASGSPQSIWSPSSSSIWKDRSSWSTCRRMLRNSTRSNTCGATGNITNCRTSARRTSGTSVKALVEPLADPTVPADRNQRRMNRRPPDHPRTLTRETERCLG